MRRRPGSPARRAAVPPDRPWCRSPLSRIGPPATTSRSVPPPRLSGRAPGRPRPGESRAQPGPRRDRVGSGRSTTSASTTVAPTAMSSASSAATSSADTTSSTAAASTGTASSNCGGAAPAPAEVGSSGGAGSASLAKTAGAGSEAGSRSNAAAGAGSVSQFAGGASTPSSASGAGSAAGSSTRSASGAAACSPGHSTCPRSSASSAANGSAPSGSSGSSNTGGVSPWTTASTCGGAAGVPRAATSVSKLNGAVEPPVSSVGRRRRLVGGHRRQSIGRRQQLLMCLFEGRPVRRTGLGADLARQLLHDFFEFGIMAGQRQRALEVLERRGRVALAVEDLRQAADGGQVLRRLAGHELELEARVVELPEVEQRPPERHPGRQVAGVPGQPFAADPDRFLGLPGAAVLFGQLREGNRRRVGFDPASQIVDTRMGHVCPQGAGHRDGLGDRPPCPSGGTCRRGPSRSRCRCPACRSAWRSSRLRRCGRCRSPSRRRPGVAGRRLRGLRVEEDVLARHRRGRGPGELGGRAPASLRR